ncbi:AAA family ATPase [Adlercreutzia sp. ZJ141]|uniref:AAA family ATPase n=1 Tax=Adlercreutzia sp. ZJ141 TaxID=2709406 RepID=UPI0013EA47E2|nr:AAA family ATPase [Adlercreutzia sp. ZJ141]
MAHNVVISENGVYCKDGARLSDRSGRKMLPIGNDDFITVAQNSIFVDKTMLIADVLNSGSVATLFCRPRRFGKSLNLSMLQRFFEIPSPDDPAAIDTSSLFEGLAIWSAEDGRYRAHHASYPVIRFSFNDVKALTWRDAFRAIRSKMASEYRRHYYLADSPNLSDAEKAQVEQVSYDQFNDLPLGRSLMVLSDLLFKHHGKRCVILIDEYDAPVMAGHTNGYYREAVSFIKGWLTGALKGNSSLAFAVLTGVQRISKESIFSDLNNLTVNTALNVASDERYGFTQDEVRALACYLASEDDLQEVRYWYDGYRFGNIDAYNPWSVLNYFQNHGVPDVYWGNTSSNSVLGELIASTEEATQEQLYTLMEPNGVVEETLDLSVTFPDEPGVDTHALWSMLYLAGYLTTDDTELPNSRRRVRPLRIPNQEIRELYRTEIVDRFTRAMGSSGRLLRLHQAFIEGNVEVVKAELEKVLLDSASSFDLVRENSYHMLVLGLMFGMREYEDPRSNREAGYGRYDVRVKPCDPNRDPLLIIELKCAAGVASDTESLKILAAQALQQTDASRYESGVTIGKAGIRRWGLAFSGKHIAVDTRTSL